MAMFNLSEKEREVQVEIRKLAEMSGISCDVLLKAAVTELWSGSAQTIRKEKIAEFVPAHGAKLYRIDFRNPMESGI